MYQSGSLALSPPLAQAVRELGYETLTPVQARCIPVLLEGRDLVGQARTGTGKTVAYALPLLQRIRADDRSLQALVLCPTRELCAQVAREVRKLARHVPELSVLTLAGGQPLHPQARALERGVQVAVGTPGRVLDHLGRGTLDLRRAGFVVLDEADRMLDMGFREDMERILGEVPPARQTVFFSATFPRSIDAMSRAFQRDPEHVVVEEEDRSGIREHAYVTDDKHGLLLALLEQLQPASALVFCNLKASVVELAGSLVRAGLAVGRLHGEMEQFDRDQVLARFRSRSLRILVATDVAARGLDIEDLDLVLNYDLPSRPEQYVHRIGRTGRAGRVGLAVSLATPREEAKLRWFETETGARFERPPAPAPLGTVTPQPAPMETLLVSGGRKDKLRPGDILGALTGEAGGLAADDVGRIEILDRLSYVAVRREVALLALRRLGEGRIKGRRFRVSRAG